ncbi:YolD-like family protein [Lentibacillus juripiscarius]|uniref:YolD-like family protein n=1 Tax=Lentibacillus juripiscarius TaxID=257446 RepID=A0ABW5V514_9BACI
MSDVNDRGTKKWTAMMLPEHEELLRKMWAEQEYKEKPILDEQQKEEIDARLQAAVNNDLTVEVKHYNGRDFLTNKGKLTRINQEQLWLGDESIIKLADVLDVYI